MNNLLDPDDIADATDEELRDELKPREYEAVKKYFFDGLQKAEIGRQMHLGKNTVNRVLCQAMRRWRGRPKKAMRKLQQLAREAGLTV